MRMRKSFSSERLADENSPAPDVVQLATMILPNGKNVDILDEREYDIVRQRYGIGTGKIVPMEIAKDYGLTRERIRQIQKLPLINCATS